MLHNPQAAAGLIPEANRRQRTKTMQNNKSQSAKESSLVNRRDVKAVTQCGNSTVQKQAILEVWSKTRPRYLNAGGALCGNVHQP